MVQFIQVNLPDDETAKFLLTELPAAGFKIVDKGAGWLTTEDDIEPGAPGMIFFEGPDGMSGQVSIQPQSDKTGLNINAYPAGS